MWKLRRPYDGAHATVPMRQRAGARMVVAQVPASGALGLLGEEPREEADPEGEGFDLVSEDGIRRFKPECFEQVGEAARQEAPEPRAKRRGRADGD